MEKGATKMAEFTPITTQEQLDKSNRRAHCGSESKNMKALMITRKKAEDYDALKAKSDGFERQIATLKQGKLTVMEKRNLGYKKQLEEAQGKIKGYETSSLKDENCT